MQIASTLHDGQSNTELIMLHTAVHTAIPASNQRYTVCQLNPGLLVEVPCEAPAYTYPGCEYRLDIGGGGGGSTSSPIPHIAPPAQGRVDPLPPVIRVTPTAAAQHPCIQEYKCPTLAQTVQGGVGYGD